MDTECAGKQQEKEKEEEEEQQQQQSQEQQQELDGQLILLASVDRSAQDGPGCPHTAAAAAATALTAAAAAAASFDAGFSLGEQPNSAQTVGAGGLAAAAAGFMQQPATAAASMPSKDSRVCDRGDVTSGSEPASSSSVDLQLPCGQPHKNLPRIAGASAVSSGSTLRSAALWTTLDQGGGAGSFIQPAANVRHGQAPADVGTAFWQQQQQQLQHSRSALHDGQLGSELQPPAAALHADVSWKETHATESSTAEVATPSFSVRDDAPIAHCATQGGKRQWPSTGGGGVGVGGGESSGHATPSVAAAVSGYSPMLPHVADGLSSGDEKDSDVEEASRQHCVPTAFGSDEEAVSFYESHRRRMHSRTPSEREAVRVIVEDIRRALAKLPPSDAAVAARHVIADASARATLPPSNGADDVWVIRDSYSEKLRRQDEQRRLRIEMERHYEEEFRRKQAEEVFHLEHENTQLMAHQERHDAAHLRTDGVGSPSAVKASRNPAAGVLSDGDSSAQPSPGTGAAVDGSEYCEHDRDIAGSWFTKKGKYRPVLVGTSDSDSDSHEDTAPRSDLAAAARAFGSKGGYDVAASSPTHRPASVQSSYVGHAARLADYRGCSVGDRRYNSSPSASATAAATLHASAVRGGGRSAGAVSAPDADPANAPVQRMHVPNSALETATAWQMQSKHELPQRPSGSRASAHHRDAGESASHCSSAAGSDGSGSVGDDMDEDDDDGLDDYADSNVGDRKTGDRSLRRKLQHQRPGGRHASDRQHQGQQHDDAASNDRRSGSADYETDDETDRLVQNEYKNAHGGVHIPEREAEEVKQLAKRSKAKEVAVYDPDDPTVLIEGILFRASYLGSTQLVSEMQPSKAMRMMQAQEAVGRIKAPDGESQPSTEVDLFVSTEKVMVLNTNLKEIIMDHSLRSISYIADIENILVLMAKRSMVTSPSDDARSSKKQQKLICHVFETEEAQLIAKSIGQAFRVAYMEFLKANGIDDPGLLKETTYEDILNQQEIAHDELDMFTRREMQKEVVISKTRGEALGVVVVESGWGSMLPTVVLANMNAIGPATRCGQLNIGDQIMAINGTSLIGLPLSTCQEHIKGLKGQTVVKLTIVSRPPVIDVLIKRPDVKYQLGFSVQNGIICSLLRGGIAERGGVRVGHRIIEINGQSVVATSHEKIVYTLSTSVGEIRMKTMPMSIFRLLTGQEVPHYI